jgi:transposase-like protein
MKGHSAGRPNRIFPTELKEEIVRRYARKDTLRELAEIFHTSVPSIRNILLAYRIKIRPEGPPRRNLVEERNKELVKAYLKGEGGQRVLAKRFNVHTTTVRKILVKYKIPIRPIGNPREPLMSTEDYNRHYYKTVTVAKRRAAKKKARA